MPFSITQNYASECKHYLVKVQKTNSITLECIEQVLDKLFIRSTLVTGFFFFFVRLGAGVSHSVDEA